jgi:hypothetical protein
MAMDYLNMIEETVVARGLEGKIIMVYGGNNLGKSKQSVQYPKTITFPFEPNALNAIGGAKKIPIYDWSSFVIFTDTMYDDKNKLEENKMKIKGYKVKLNLLKKEDKNIAKEDLEDHNESKSDLVEKIERTQEKIDNSSYVKFREQVSTLVIDSLTALGKSAEKYITDSAGVEQLGDGNRGKLYKGLENSFYFTINKFFNLGDFTYLILAHEDFRDIGLGGDDDEKIMQAVPKGEWKRIVKPVIDRCDIVAYLKGNGMDEDYNAIPSSAILVECNTCFARTKWDNMTNYIKEYSAENLEKVLNEAITEQEKEGVKVGSFEDQQGSFTESLSVSYEDMKAKIGELVTKIYAHDGDDLDGKNMLEYGQIVESQLGVGVKVSDTNKQQVKALTVILEKTEKLAQNLK